MLEKLFTTKMSADKRKLQLRFSKIRSKNSYISKAIAIVLFLAVLIAVVSASVYVAVNVRQSGEKPENIKFTFNGKPVAFKNKPYILSETMSDGYKGNLMAFFPLEELCLSLDAQCEINGNRALIKIPETGYAYELEAGNNKIFYDGGKGIYEAAFGPEIRDYIIYIPYEFIEYIWINSNNYNIFASMLYENGEMNVRFEIPMYWLGKYICDETEVSKGVIVFKHKRISELYDYDEILFTLRKKADKDFDKLLNIVENQTVVWRNPEYGYIIGRPTDPYYQFKRQIKYNEFLHEYENMRRGIDYIESTFSLIKDVKTSVITNAEDMSYAAIQELQRQVDNGHFPWRLDYEQVIRSFISGKGYSAEEGYLGSFAGDGEKCSGIFILGNYRHHIELFKPVDKSEKGIWIVRSYKMVEPVQIKEVSFYKINPENNTLSDERIKLDEGWYKLPAFTGSFVNFNGAVPETVTAYFTVAGTNAEETKKQVGFAKAPFKQIPISVALNFEKDDNMGHLYYVFGYEDGSTVRSDLYNILIN